jgi:hypothetical protein
MRRYRTPNRTRAPFAILSPHHPLARYSESPTPMLATVGDTDLAPAQRIQPVTQALDQRC